MLQRLTVIVRLQRDPAAQDWCGQIEMVTPHREATFRDRRELWDLLENWTERPISGSPSAEEEKTSKQ
jgi:hypothetical protein